MTGDILCQQLKFIDKVTNISMTNECYLYILSIVVTNIACVLLSTCIHPLVTVSSHCGQCKTLHIHWKASLLVLVVNTGTYWQSSLHCSVVHVYMFIACLPPNNKLFGGRHSIWVEGSQWLFSSIFKWLTFHPLGLRQSQRFHSDLRAWMSFIYTRGKSFWETSWT